MSSSIHATAIVAANASIGDDVSIGPYTIIGDNVSIGSGTRIDSHVVINGPTEIGCDNHIYQFASIGDDPQDKKYRGEPTQLTIGDRNTIREFCTISRGTTQDRGHTILGDDNWIMAYVHIAHDCMVGSKTIMANNVTLAGHVDVGDWVIFGGFSGAHQFTKIGAHAFLGMYSGVNRDVPAYVLVGGQPASLRIGRAWASRARPRPRRGSEMGLMRGGKTAGAPPGRRAGGASGREPNQS